VVGPKLPEAFRLEFSWTGIIHGMIFKILWHGFASNSLILACAMVTTVKFRSVSTFVLIGYCDNF
jgi:hypothetical protein